MNASPSRARAFAVVAVNPAPSAPQLARQRWFAATDPRRVPHIIDGLYRELAPRIRSRLLSLGIPERDVRDVCQEVFIVAHQRLPTYRGEASISTWLYGIARRVASDYRRSARVRVETLTDTCQEDELDENDPHRSLEGVRRCEAVHEALKMLKPTQRAVVRAFALAELPMEMVAGQEGVPAQTAYARLYAGQNALREILTGNEAIHE